MCNFKVKGKANVLSHNFLLKDLKKKKADKLNERLHVIIICLSLNQHVTQLLDLYPNCDSSTHTCIYEFNFIHKSV